MTSPIIKTVQWAPDGLMSGVPGTVLFLLSEDGKHFGYGPGPGPSMHFGTFDRTGVDVNPGQWVARHADGTASVWDTDPLEAR